MGMIPAGPYSGLTPRSRAFEYPRSLLVGRKSLYAASEQAIGAGGCFSHPLPSPGMGMKRAAHPTRIPRESQWQLSQGC